ncbi:MAG: branched-chain amino acid ABC transporter permease [Marinosulfonomonas sp.]|nr:branched-chain amino acid ABC transporter permease [Marinosulfonomonas sp.]
MSYQLFLQVLANGVFTGILFGGIAVALAICNLADRSLHVAIGSVIALISFFWLAIVRGEIPVVLGFILLAGVALAANLACLAVYRWLSRRGVNAEGIVVASFGLLIAGNSALELIYGTELESMRAPWLQGKIKIGGIRFFYSDMIMSGVVLSMMAALWATLRSGGLSLQLRSVFHDPREAAIAGVNIPLIQVLAYAFSAVLVIIIALSIGSRSSVHPHMGFFPLLIGIAALVTGGLGSVRSAFLSGIAMGIIWDFVGIYFGTVWQFASVFGILAVVLLTAPEGLFSLKFRWRRKATEHNM